MPLISINKQQEIDSILESFKVNSGLSYPENSLIDIARSLGLAVYEANFKIRSPINGAIQYADEKTGLEPKIILNKQYSPERKTFTLAHELGHFVLHQGKQKYRIDKHSYPYDSKEALEESEANYFAASLLVPADKLIKLLKLTGGNSFDQIAKYFGVSKPVIENRVKWLKRKKVLD